MQQQPDWQVIALHGSFAALGGLVRVLRVHRRGAYHWAEFVAGAFIGTFAGMITYAICRHLGQGEYLTIALVGLAGYSGTPLLDIAAAALRYRLTREGEPPAFAGGKGA